MAKVNKNILTLDKGKDEIRETILINIVKMLTHRKLLKKTGHNKNIELLKKSKNEEDEYNLSLLNKKKYFIKFVSHKITTINKSSGILDFLDTNINNPFMIISPEMSTKPIKELKKKYVNAELFLEHELLINLMDHILVPEQYKIDVDTNKFLEERNCKRKDFPRILLTDPVSKYLNLKEGEIIRIIRPSESSGRTVSYRIGTRGKMNKK